MQRFGTAFLVTTCFVFGLSTKVSAQDAPDKDPGVRLLYSGRNLSVQDLAIFLTNSYAGEGGMKFVAAPSANVMSIRTSTQRQMDDVLKTLEVADKAKQLVEFQALIIDYRIASGGDAAPDIDTDLLTGSAEDVLKVARTWVREGKLARVKVYNLTALDNQIGSTSTNEIVPRSTSPVTSSRTPVEYKDQKLGVTFSVIPRINDTRDILCEMVYSSTELNDKTSQDAAAGAERAHPNQVVEERTQTTIKIPNEHSVIVSGRDGNVKTPHPAGLLIVSANITESKSAAAKSTKPK